MPNTLLHGFLPYLVVSFFTKNKKYKLLGLIAGMLPDLDGIFIFFNMDLYYALHRELLHMPFLGIIFGLIAGLVFYKVFKLSFVKSFAIFSFAFILHAITDVFFTNWFVRLLWPFSMQEFSYPIFLQEGLFVSLVITLIGLVILILDYYPKNYFKLVKK